MTVYWLLFTLFAFTALLARPAAAQAAAPGLAQTAMPGAPPTVARGPALVLVALILTLVVGLRYEVGADWDTYEFIFRAARLSTFGQALDFGDPAYQLLNWCASALGSDIWLVNLVCAAIFTWGLIRFCQIQSNPWLALVIATPYLILVVGMGYTRQAVALGCVMAGMASLARGGGFKRFLFYVLAGTLFHKSALVAVLLLAFTGDRNRLLGLLGGMLLVILLYSTYLSSGVEVLVNRYSSDRLQSEGALIRVVMNLVPGIVFLLFHRRMEIEPLERSIYMNLSLAAVMMVPLYYILPSTTAVDRLSLYLVPLQLAVLSRVPGSLLGLQLGRLLMIIYSAAIMFVWLNFAQHAKLWLPYDNNLF